MGEHTNIKNSIQTAIKNMLESDTYVSTNKVVVKIVNNDLKELIEKMTAELQRLIVIYKVDFTIKEHNVDYDEYLAKFRIQVTENSKLVSTLIGQELTSQVIASLNAYDLTSYSTYIGQMILVDSNVDDYRNDFDDVEIKRFWIDCSIPIIMTK